MKIKTKSELTSRVNKIDLLDFIAVEINKFHSDTSKAIALRKFYELALAYIKDQRDVELIAVKKK